MFYKFEHCANDIGLKAPYLEAEAFQGRTGLATMPEDFVTSNIMSIIPIIRSYDCAPRLYLETPRDVIFNNIDFSLPQHYGLPTRLLDFTLNPIMAAFFSGYSYLKHHQKNSNVDSLIVYILKADNSRAVSIKSGHIRINNPFLHAQEGIFIQPSGDFFYFEHGRWPSLEEVSSFPDQEIELTKITINAELAKDLLNKIHAHYNIGISKLMPHYRYVAEEVLNSL